MVRLARLGWLVLVAHLLVGCVQNTAYRTHVGFCSSAQCVKTASLETDVGSDYLLGVVEFDDQGKTYQRDQMDALFSELERQSATQDLCLVVFVHGWENNASYDNPNIREFRDLLARLAATENEHVPGVGGKPRKVVGIYAGWRGQSVDAGDLSAITFWDRKAAAQRVALGSIRELLGRARTLRDSIDRDTSRSTRLLTIGHSFGGLIVYTALAQYYTDRAAAIEMARALGNTTEQEKMIEGYGDLVVIINPAIEAISWEPIRQIVKHLKTQDYARNQPPVFVEVTSKADEATGIAFPAGRLPDVITEDFVDEEEREEASATIGHYQPFWTHDLTSADDAAALQVALAKTSAADAVATECRSLKAFEATYRRDGYLQPGWTRKYSAGAVLKHRSDSAFDPNDPFWIVNTDKPVIYSHSDIDEPIFEDFVRQLYDDLLLVKNKKPTC